jgi:uncharacterized membrane protein YqjE
MRVSQVTIERGGLLEDASAQRAGEGTVGLLHNAMGEAGRLVAAEVQLAKRELAESLHAAVMGLLTGAVTIFAIIAFLVMTIVAVVVAVPLHWVAAIACAGVFLVIAAVGAIVALGRLKQMSLMRQTIATLKEDVEWAKQQLTAEEK